MFPKKLGSKNGKTLLQNQMILSQIVPESPDQLLNFELKGNYNYNTNIMEIHQYIINKIKSENKNIGLLETEVKTMEKTLETEQMSYNDRRTYEKKIDKNKQQLEELYKEKKLTEYMERSSTILNVWKDLDNETNSLKKIGTQNEFCPKKLNLVRIYLRIAMDYSTDLYLTISIPDDTCSICFSQLDKDDEDNPVCNGCGNQSVRFTEEITYDDLLRINTCNNNYHNREVFEQIINSYEGRQKTAWNYEELEAKVDEYCMLKQINKMTLTPQDMYHKIFKAISYNNYNDGILFTHLYNGWKLPSIPEYRQILLQDYEQFYIGFEEVIKNEDRKSALNCFFMLYILIQRRNIPHNKDNFKLPETKTILSRADKIARKVFEILEEKRIEDGNYDEPPWIYKDTV